MLEHSWTVAQKESTATLLLSKPTASHYYHYKAPFTHKMWMGLLTLREQSAMPLPYIWKWAPDTRNWQTFLLPTPEIMMYS